jgi:hypothetical protein
MNAPKTALSLQTQLHRNLKSLATVATPATAMRGGAFSRCRLVKEVATTGNTPLFIYQRARHLPSIWLSLLPVKKHWQQKRGFGNAWKTRSRAVVATVATVAGVFETRRTCVCVFSRYGAAQ